MSKSSAAANPCERSVNLARRIVRVAQLALNRGRMFSVAAGSVLGELRRFVTKEPIDLS